MNRRSTTLSVAVCAGIAVCAAARAQNLTVVSVAPAANSMADRNAAIVVEFDRPVNPATVATPAFWAYARWSGPAEGAFALSNGDRTVTLTPNGAFSGGELVTVYLSHDLRGADGAPLRSAGYSFQFYARSVAANMDWRRLDTLTVRTNPGTLVRTYGGVASDLDNDGWLDLTMVNEVAGDLRVFLNRDDGSGLFHPFLLPPTTIGLEASPNEPGDFNRDGKADLCTANATSGSVSIVLGNGNGTYAPQQQVQVGQGPHGIIVLDADGDGDQDIVNTNTGSNNMSVLLNNGAGVFGPPAFYEGGGAGEWALAAADMNEDGIMDAVVGAQGNQRVIVNRGNGNGTFTPLTPVTAAGGTWMLAAADMNGDGHADAMSANNSQSGGTILFGNGAGALGPPTTYPCDPFPIGSDVGDLDGDGDLDWVLSSFGGEWLILENNGAGVFTNGATFPASQAASCSILFDFDNDHDLDLALVDELADEFTLWDNGCYADCNDDGQTTVGDFGCFQGRYVLGHPYADCNNSGSLTVADFGCFQTRYTLGCP
ncbi:MAG: FG-GAP-like repeat-containing protein [Phycisphaerales bacterium]